jgi:hypothetical protein
VEITIGQDDAHRLTVRYRAPAAATHLDFLLADARTDRLVRVPLMMPVDDCGALVPGGIALRRGGACEETGARFVVTPHVLDQDALYEPAQPASDGSVLFYTGYYAAAAPGAGIRWRFEPRPGDYGIDEGVRHDEPWTVDAGPAYAPAATGTADPRDDEAWLQRQHAQHDVFLGHAPARRSGGLTWVHDPQLPPAIVDTVGAAGPVAWQAYERASGVSPPGPAAIVMLAAPPVGQFTAYHGDRSAGNMIRLSFVDVSAAPRPRALERWARFVAHELAHLWNHGVYTSDQARPWLHEGDAEWAAMNAMHSAGLLSDGEFLDEIADSVNRCLLLHGDTPEAAFGTTRGELPYACGVALQFLGWTALRHDEPAAREDALSRWGQLHHRFPRLDVAGFAKFFDGDHGTRMRTLLLDPHAPFAATYVRELAALTALDAPAGEPAGAELRDATGGRLLGLVVRADCDRIGFVRGADGVATLDTGLACRALPAGARIVRIAGEAVAGRPRAAWAAASRACEGGGAVDVGLAPEGLVHVACPAGLPAAPAWIRLPEDTPARLGLASGNVLAKPSPAAPISNP